MLQKEKGGDLNEGDKKVKTVNNQHTKHRRVHVFPTSV